MKMQFSRSNMLRRRRGTSTHVAPFHRLCTSLPKARRGRARTPKAVAKQNRHLRNISHAVPLGCDASAHNFQSTKIFPNCKEQRDTASIR